MKPWIKMHKLRKFGIVLTIIMIAGFVIGIAYLVRIIFDYRISEALIAATIAAVSLFYEIRKSKKLNEAEFLIHLNSLFITNEDYKKVYNLLSQYDFDNEPDLEQEITNCEISNYLTLFETLYILLKRKVIDLSTLDDLFAYRFFLAVHNPYIQRKKLACSPQNFKNIFRLERMWLNYRKAHHEKENYFGPSYHLLARSDLEAYMSVFDDRTQKKIQKSLIVTPMPETYSIEPLDIHDFDQINDMQLKAVIEMDAIKKDVLRANDEAMIKSCLDTPHEGIKVMSEGQMIAFGILYDPSVEPNESLLKDIDVTKFQQFRTLKIEDTLQIKLVIVDPNHRKKHLQVHINKSLEKIAKQKGKKCLLTTVSPFNHASVVNTKKSGFNYVRSLSKYQGAIRMIYAKFI